jgi:hypothetical protein
MSSDLLQQCAAARAAGLDFPTVWQTILRRHPLVGGSPIQMADGKRIWLEVPLTTGDRLIIDSQAGYSVRSASQRIR